MFVNLDVSSDMIVQFKKGDLKKGEKIHVDDRNDWVQCVKCEKWRELPPGVSPDDLVGDW